MKLDLSIIIVGFNTQEYILKCIQSIKLSKIEKIKIEIIVVDNASTDNSMDEIKKIYPDVVRIQNKENFGFAKANNLGVKKAQGRYVLFLNPDTVLADDVLLATVNFMDENKDCSVVSPRLELSNGQLDEASHRGFPTPWNAFTHFSGLSKLFPTNKFFSGYTMGWKINNPNPHEVDSVVGAFYMVRREAGESVGWWDEDYFWYGDELDFSYRLKEKGWKIMFIPKLKVLHYKGVSSGIISQSSKITTASKETKLRSAQASTRAMEIFYNKHYKNKYPFIVNWIVLSGISLLSGFRQLKHSI